MSSENIEIDSNLVLRAATADDAENVAELNQLVHGNPEKNESAVRIGIWTRDLFSGVTRAVKPSDFTVVEDTSTGKIVSSMCLMSQTWNIGGIDTPMGMPEIVGTHPDYRRRGLVRKQFDLMHRWSEDRGHLFNTIMGIGFYYRQFEYEYAIDAWGGSTTSPSLLGAAANTKKGPPALTGRDAQTADARFIADTYITCRERAYVTVNIDAQTFEDAMFGRNEGSAVFYRGRILELGGEPVAFYLHHVRNKKEGIRVFSFEISSSVNWSDATTSMVADLQELVERFHPDGKERSENIEFSFGRKHPAYTIFEQPLGAPLHGYAWYVRVPGIARLVTHLGPLLEQRLAKSVFRGWTGDIKITFFTDGINLSFEDGALKSVSPTGMIETREAAAAYPGLTFLKALFAQHSFSELQAMYPDCSAQNFTMATMQDTLFGGPLSPAVLPAN